MSPREPRTARQWVDLALASPTSCDILLQCFEQAMEQAAAAMRERCARCSPLIIPSTDPAFIGSDAWARGVEGKNRAIRNLPLTDKTKETE